jgi:replicative DNA helicase
MLTDLAYVHNAPIEYQNILNHVPMSDGDMRRLVKASEDLRDLPVQIEEQRGLTLSEIQARARKMASQFDRDGRRLEVLFVDHLGLIKPSSWYRGSRVNEVAEISDGLATLAKDLDVAVVALCQLNRGR